MAEIFTFAEIEVEFIERAHTMVWCNCATVDAQNRPRSRVLHPIWAGATGWVLTGRNSPKAKHLERNRFVSLAYLADPLKPVYAECEAMWEEDSTTRRRISELFKNTPPPLGYDPALFLWNAENPESGLLRLQPWRIELADLFNPQSVKTWRPAG